LGIANQAYTCGNENCVQFTESAVEKAQSNVNGLSSDSAFRPSLLFPFLKRKGFKA
jgi:hypothetical protein